jgi:hypothetical protein
VTAEPRQCYGWIMAYPIISADSHITEPPTMYRDHIDPRFRDRAPHVQHI